MTVIQRSAKVSQILGMVADMTINESLVRQAPKVDEPLTHPVGATEIAERLAVRRQTVHNWNQDRIRQRSQDPMPPPRWVVGDDWAWNLGDVIAWAKRTNRLPPGPPDPMHQVKDWPYRYELCDHGVRYQGRGAPTGEATRDTACPTCFPPEAVG